MYLEYDEYKTYGGKLDITAFQGEEFKARKLIDERTFGRIKETNENIKRCIYELITNANTNKLKSESVDGWSKTYLDSNEQDAVLTEIIETFLAREIADGVPLLYRGVL